MRNPGNLSSRNKRHTMRREMDNILATSSAVKIMSRPR
jgi:hypothetical protein